MSKLRDKINADIKDAMRSKEEIRLSVLRMLIAALMNKKIEFGNKRDLTEEEVVAVLKSELKKRKESFKAYVDADRKDLADKEEAEVCILEKYMPEQMSEEDIEKVIKEVTLSMGEVGSADFGKVMGAVMGKLKNKADGQEVSAAVKKVLLK